MNIKNIFQKFFCILIISSFCLYIILSVCIIFYYPSNKAPNSNSRLLVVFGAGYQKSGEPVKALKFRLDEAIEVLNKQENSNISNVYIFISGRKEEVHVMEEYLLDKNIPQDQIIQDIYGYNTRSTVQNAIEFSQLLDTMPIYISQAYHLPRISLYSFTYGKRKFETLSTDRQTIATWEMIRLSIRESTAIFLFPIIYLNRW